MSWQEFKEHSVKSGLGTALCVMLPNESKYHILCAVESLPAVFGTPNTIEYSTTTNRNITNITGKNTTENIEINIAYNIDNITLCNKIKDVQCKYAYIDLDDFTGQEFTAVARYHMAEVGTDSIKQIVLSLTVFSAEETITKDLYDTYMDTIVFENIPSVVRVAVSETKEIVVATEPSTVTIPTQLPNTSSSVATATYDESAKKITIKGVAKGSCIVTVEATSSDYASNQREIKVIVE